MEAIASSSAPVAFFEHFANSTQFDALFRDGMGLVREAADYLDGPGRIDARRLPSELSVICATESMRLTTRLLELASWLVVQRALRDGELTAQEAHAKRSRIRLRTMSRPSHIRHFEDLPLGLQELIARSFALTDRVHQLDKALSVGFGGPVAAPAPSVDPVGDQLRKLGQAFTAGTVSR